ncbi:hypothetical protein H5071_07490, partial [Shewanella sp. SR41-2]|nr:hypothetical protein [Shewanella sp. SR41-2]
MRIIRIIFVSAIILSSAITSLFAEENSDPIQPATTIPPATATTAEPVTPAITTPAVTSAAPVTPVIANPAVTPPTPKQSAKKPAMGHDYQKNMPKLGKGDPNYRGGKEVVSDAQPIINNPESQSKESSIIDNQRKSGADVGFPGYRGEGDSAYPQHQQYQNPPRFPAESIETTPADTS